MIERLVFVAEVIGVIRNDYLIAAFLYFPHPRQSRLRVRFPLTMLISLILRLRYLPQVPDAVVEAVAVDVVNLQRWKTAVMPRPDRFVHLNKINFTGDSKCHTQITVFAVSFTILSASHGHARFPVHELSAAVVVVVILLDASHQCGQLAIR